MKKKIGFILAIMILASSLLSACGGDGSGTSTTAASAANNGAAETTKEKTETKENKEPENDENFNATGFPVVNERITLSAVVRGDPNYTKPYEELELNKKWTEDTNIDVEWRLFDSTSWEEKVNLMLVSGELPDIVFGPISTYNELTYAQQGYWQPIQDLISEYTVHVKEFSEMYPEIYNSYYTPDGNVYSLARLKGQEDMEYMNRIYINQEWLEAVSLDMPKNVDEFYAVLKAFKDQDPNGNGKADEIPLAFRYDFKSSDRKTGGDARNSLVGLFGLFGRIDTIDHIVIEDGKPVFTADKDEYKNAVSWFHQLASEGMLDPEAFTMDTTAFKAKNTTGDTVYGVWSGWTVEEATNPPEKGIETYAMMPPLENVNGDQIWPRFSYNVANQGYFFITKNNQYPRESIRWIDYLSDPYVSIEHDWGIEDLGSKINDDGSWEILGGGLVTSRTAEGMAWLVPTMVPKHIYDRCVYTSPVKKFEADSCAVYSPYGVEVFPNAYHSLEDAQEIIQYSTDIGSYVGKMTSQWIIEGGIDEQWDEYVKTLDSLGLSRYLEIYNSTYDRYLESFK